DLVSVAGPAHLVGVLDLPSVMYRGPGKHEPAVEMRLEPPKAVDDLSRRLDNQLVVPQEARRSAELGQRGEGLVGVANDHLSECRAGASRCLLAAIRRGGSGRGAVGSSVMAPPRFDKIGYWSEVKL